MNQAPWYRPGTQTPEAAAETAALAAWGAWRDELDGGMPMLALLRRALDGGDTTLIRAISSFAPGYLADRGRDVELPAVSQALVALDEANHKARAQVLAAIDNLEKAKAV